MDDDDATVTFNKKTGKVQLVLRGGARAGDSDEDGDEGGSGARFVFSLR